MAKAGDDYSRNGVPLMGPVAKQGSNLSAGAGAPSNTSGFGAVSAKAAGQDFTRNPVPLESPPPTAGQGAPSQQDWLAVARENYQVSQNWFDISVRRRIEDNLAHTYSRHASGSKYYTPDYDKRSKYFRPKTRSMLRKGEAAAALAYFSTMEVVNCEPLNEADPAQVTAAKVHTGILNYRFRRSIPWFKTCLGSYFDAMTQGVVISCQEWRYQEVEIVEDEYQNGAPTGASRTKSKIKRDTPWVRIIPVENLRVHPSCDWVDPINSSPYLIEQIPWFVEDLAAHIAKGRSYGCQVPYIKDFGVDELMAGGSDQQNTAQVLRQAREHVRLDRFSQVQQGQHNRVVWVHRNIVRGADGEDYVYETLGTTLLLSEPVPLEEVFGIERRPYVMGSCTIETHRPYPSGPVEMLRPTQDYANDIVNQRNDNIRLALNNRYLAKRGQMTDMRSLMRNVPGSITMTTDPANDVKQLETKDVTSSAYQEQDRIDLDFGDLAGFMGQAQVGAIASRDNQRVRNTELVGQGADLITELSLRTHAETWVEPVLAQLVELEAQFETDQTVLTFAANVAGQEDWQSAFRSLQEPVGVTVSVGFGNTDPLQRIQRLTIGLKTVQETAPTMAQSVNGAEVAREVMGILGYKDGSRFFAGIKAQAGQDPQVAALQQQVQSLQQQLQQDAQKYQSMENVAKIRAQSAENIANIKAKTQHDIALGTQAAKHYVAGLQAQIRQMDLQIAREKNVIAQGNLLLEREALSNAIMQADREFQLKLAEAAVPQLPTAAAPITADEPFIESLRGNANGSAVPKLPGSGDAGTIERNHFGMLPGAAG